MVQYGFILVRVKFHTSIFTLTKCSHNVECMEVTNLFYLVSKQYVKGTKIFIS